MTSSAEVQEIGEEDRLRADLYDFLAALLVRPPTPELLHQTRNLTGDDTPLGETITTLAKVAGATGPEAAEREFNRLFIGVGRGELMPFASFYMTGFLNEKPLAALREDMLRLGVERSPHVFEPEDNIGSLCEMMAGLITGRFGRPATIWDQRQFWTKHIGPWAPHFFTDLEGARNSLFYAPVGAVGRVFMEIEKEAFRLSGEAA